MLPYTQVSAKIYSRLDAEGSQYYTDLQDVIPAVNSAQNTISDYILRNLGAKKFSEEKLKGLIQNRIFQPNIYSGIYLDGSFTTWAIISVIVNPLVATPPAAITTYVPIVVPANESAFNPNFVYAGGGQACTRVNSQEFLSNQGNPFMAGYVSSNPTPQNVSYCYLNPVDRQSFIDTAMPYEIIIRPNISNTSPVSIVFLVQPTPIVSPSDNFVWSPNMSELLVEGALWSISYKQGDKSSIWELSGESEKQLLASLV